VALASPVVPHGRFASSIAKRNALGSQHCQRVAGHALTPKLLNEYVIVVGRYERELGDVVTADSDGHNDLVLWPLWTGHYWLADRRLLDISLRTFATCRCHLGVLNPDALAGVGIDPARSIPNRVPFASPILSAWTRSPEFFRRPALATVSRDPRSVVTCASTPV
jgi:hypothetical protein